MDTEGGSNVLKVCTKIFAFFLQISQFVLDSKVIKKLYMSLSWREFV